MVRLERHDGERWRLVLIGPESMVRCVYDTLVILHTETPLRMVESESRLTAAMHDPRRGYAYQGGEISNGR